MVFDLLNRRRPRRPGKPKDEYDVLIQVIEKFAPSKYAGEREMYYYNYRAMPLYAGPLLSLLQLLSQRHRLAEEESGFADEVFRRLKAFYDPKGRLSSAQTQADEGLHRKHREVYLFFYGRGDMTAGHGKG